MKITVYNNSRCSTCRVTLGLLNEKGAEVEKIEYLEHPPTKEELEGLLKKLGMRACGLVRKKEPLYKEMFAGRDPTDEECLNAMAENPVLIERPIVVRGNKAILGRPPEKVLTLLS